MPFGILSAVGLAALSDSHDDPEIASPSIVPEANYGVDGPVAAGAILGWWVMYGKHADWVALRCPCNAQQVNDIERFA